jgi:biotin transport system substrate-specific component
MSTTQTIHKVQKISTKDLVMTGMFTAIICVMSQIAIPTQPIPFTLALLAIFLTGALLSPRYAFFAVLAYLLLGAFGVPVFAGMKGGLQQLTGYTGGYLAAYPLMAFVTSLSYKLSKKNKIVGLTIGMLLSLLLCYLIGTAWFTVLTDNSFYAALTMCVFPFVLFDLIKIVLAVSISTVIRKTAFRNM